MSPIAFNNCAGAGDGGGGDDGGPGGGGNGSIGVDEKWAQALTLILFGVRLGSDEMSFFDDYIHTHRMRVPQPFWWIIGMNP